MPRLARVAFPQMPHHVFQRGHSRNDVFYSDSDRADYLGTLGECRALFGIRVYAYCLMTNHVHLVIAPGEDATTLSRLMQRLSTRHSRRLNHAHGWSGSVWESRFHCSPIDTERYLLTCGRYVDQNPVRARMVSTPDAYPWSSYRARSGSVTNSLLDPDPAIEALASTPPRRFEIYRELASTPLSENDLAMIRGATQRNQLTGDAPFVDKVRRETGRHVPARRRGRPESRKKARS